MVDFLLIGPRGAIVYKDMFKFIKDRKIVFGYNSVSDFDNNNKSVICRWFQNMVDYHPELVLSRRYSDGEYKKYDNAEFINIDRTDDIPDYDGLMGVPITFLDKWNPDQFDVIKRYYDNYIDGKSKYYRLLIKRK